MTDEAPKFPVHDIMTNGWPGERTLDAIGALPLVEREDARQYAGIEDLLAARLVAGARVRKAQQEREERLHRYGTKRSRWLGVVP